MSWEPVAAGDAEALVTGDPERVSNPFRRARFLIPAGVLAVLILAAVFPGAVGAGDPFDCTLDRSLRGPSLAHPFGFDLQGCDYYTKVVYGARASLAIGFSVVGAAALIGLIVGGIAGYYGGFFDALVGRIGEVLLAMPLVLTGVVVLTLIERRGMVHVILVLVILGWPPMVRLVRAQVMAAKHETYVEAARALGARDLRILRKHIIPNALWPVVVYASAYVGVAITAEALLSFFGAGLQLPDVSWGLMIGQVRTRVLGAPHLLIPAAFLSLTVAAFVFLGEALRSVSEPARA